MKKISGLILIVLILMTGCSGSSPAEKGIKTMLYDFKEPAIFPFEVNEVRTEIAVDNIDVLQQFVFHYKNKQTAQEIRYILSKVIDEPEKLSGIKIPTIELKNGKQAYYEEDDTSQSIWWEADNGFLARFSYYVNGNMGELNDNKLDKSSLIELANQVQ